VPRVDFESLVASTKAQLAQVKAEAQAEKEAWQAKGVEAQAKLDGLVQEVVALREVELALDRSQGEAQGATQARQGILADRDRLREERDVLQARVDALETQLRGMEGAVSRLQEGAEEVQDGTMRSLHESLRQARHEADAAVEHEQNAHEVLTSTPQPCTACQLMRGVECRQCFKREGTRLCFGTRRRSWRPR